MKRCLLLLAALGAPGVATAQGTPAAAYARYASAVTARADSVVGFLTSQVGDLTNEAAVTTLATGTERMTRLARAFAATEPPADLAAVHGDLVAALTTAAAKSEHAVALMRTAMDSTASDERRTTAAVTAQTELTDLQSAINTYQAARQRATRIFAQHGVTLPAN